MNEEMMSLDVLLGTRIWGVFLSVCCKQIGNLLSMLRNWAKLRHNRNYSNLVIGRNRITLPTCILSLCHAGQWVIDGVFSGMEAKGLETVLSVSGFCFLCFPETGQYQYVMYIVNAEWWLAAGLDVKDEMLPVSCVTFCSLILLINH